MMILDQPDHDEIERDGEKSFAGYFFVKMALKMHRPDLYLKTGLVIWSIIWA